MRGLAVHELGEGMGGAGHGNQDERDRGGEGDSSRAGREDAPR